MQIMYKGNWTQKERGKTVQELFSKEIEESEVEVIACRFDNEVKRLDYRLEREGELELVDISTKDGMRIYRRGLLYIVSKALYETYPDALLTVNYQLQHALLCELENMEMTEEMLESVNRRVQEIIQEDIPIIKKSMTKEEARMFYADKKTRRGRLQLDAKDKRDVTLYYAGEYFNYFYGILPLSTGYVREYELVKYHDGFLIRFPSSKSPTVLNEFVESPKLLEALDRQEDVHKLLGINTVERLNKSIRDGKIKEYMLLDEALQEKKISKIADCIASNKDIRVIAIARTIFFRENNFF
ncbi:MAG: hypothetical protein FWC79_08610 [Oscillospiraceae bacterium]|nr:hypothetical protein [Oscillospiraceae bacterium]